MHCVTLNNIRILFFCYASRTNLSVIPNEHQSMPGVNGPPTKITMLNPHDSELEGVLFLLYFSVVCPSWSFLEENDEQRADWRAGINSHRRKLRAKYIAQHFSRTKVGHENVKGAAVRVEFPFMWRMFVRQFRVAFSFERL